MLENKRQEIGKAGEKIRKPGKVARAEVIYDVAPTREVVNTGQMFLSGFTWKWQHCLVDLC